MKNDDSSAPATKKDISMIMDSIGKLYIDMEQWKDDIIEETDNRFQVVIEDLRHDLLGMHSDKIDWMSDKVKKHEKRISKIERHVGLSA